MNTHLKLMIQKITREQAIVELEALVRKADRSLDVDLLQGLEIAAEYQTYEKVRKAACLVREALNELYEETLKVKGA